MWSPCARRDFRECNDSDAKNPVYIHYYTLLHITALSQSFSPLCLPESWITKCGPKLIYETLLEKEVVYYILPITSILWRLPVFWAGDTGTIPFGYSNGCRNRAHSYNHDLASADSSRGAVNSWAVGWSSDPWSAMKCSVWKQDICYYTLLHIILYYYIHHYYILLHSLILHC